MTLIKWNFQITDEHLEWIRKYCKKTNLSQSDVVRLALDDYIKKHQIKSEG
jgi:hypothetical protein